MDLEIEMYAEHKEMPSFKEKIFTDLDDIIKLGPELSGIKGFNLAKLSKLNFLVPKFFIVNSDTYKDFIKNEVLNKKIVDAISGLITCLVDDKSFSFSVRSSGNLSMPGIMETFLNIGLLRSRFSNKDPEHYLHNIQEYKFLLHYVDNLLIFLRLIDIKKFEKLVSDFCLQDIFLNGHLDKAKFIAENASYAISLKEKLEDQISKYQRYNLLDKIIDQVLFSIEKVFESSFSERANFYKNDIKLESELSVACVVQLMVYGDIDGGSGVCFSRNPIDGTQGLYGEICLDSQGIDVVSGSVTPMDLNKNSDIIEKRFSGLISQLKDVARILEEENRYPQDIEFTVSNKILYLMQTRNAKMTSFAQLITLMDLIEKNKISREESLELFKNIDLSKILYSHSSPKSVDIISAGIACSLGAIRCKVAINESYIEQNHDKFDLVLIKEFTCVEDYKMMSYCKAIITKIGGSTSHAAVIARAMNKPSVCGVSNLEIYSDKIILNGKAFYEGQDIVVDGSLGYILYPYVEIFEPKVDVLKLTQILSYLRSEDQHSVEIVANADTPQEMVDLIDLKISKVGLCRTEHMLLDQETLIFFRKYLIAILENDKFDDLFRKQCSSEFIKSQTDKFIEILNSKLEIKIRLLDPPLHEFFNLNSEAIENLSKVLNIDNSSLIKILDNLKEINPMLGNRGARLGITMPQIYFDQILSILKAAIRTQNYKIGITIPFINDVQEFIYIKNLIKQAKNYIKDGLDHDTQKEIDSIKIGVMIETVRSIYLSKQLARECDYFSFGTNDLTQMVFGISRDDIHSFAKPYYNLWGFDPFKTIDKLSVGKLIKLAVEEAKEANPEIEFSVCGEQARDQESIMYLSEIGIKTFSVSISSILQSQLFALK